MLLTNVINRLFIKVQEEFGSFSKHICGFVDGKQK
jgi:hypothetical protein